MLVHGRRSHQDPSQAMVGSNSHTEADGFAGDQRPFLHIHPWKHQRNLQHEKGSHGQAPDFITRYIFCSSTSRSLMDQDIWYLQALR